MNIEHYAFFKCSKFLLANENKRVLKNPEPNSLPKRAFGMPETETMFPPLFIILNDFSSVAPPIVSNTAS